MKPATPERIVSTLVHALKSDEVSPDDVLRLVGWSPKEWTSNTTTVGDGNDTVLSAMAKQIGHRGRTALWVDAMLDVVAARGRPSSEVWATVLTTVYNKTGESRDPIVIKSVEKWRAIGDATYWNKEGGRILQAAFDHKHWDEVDAVLAAGVSADTKIEAGQKNYGTKDRVPLLAASPCVQAAAVGLKHNANPLVEVEGVSLLEWVEARAEQCFENGNERRETVKVLRGAAQKALETASPELLEQHQKNQLWATLKNAKSWMDIQNSIQSMAASVKNFKGVNGEPFLFALAAQRPEFIPNLMRMKASSSDWWTAKDRDGAGFLHYLACSKGTGTYTYRRETNEKVRKLIDECAPPPPKTKEEWEEWHKVLWASQIKNADKISTEPTIEAGNHSYGQDAGTNDVRWAQNTWDTSEVDPAFGRLDQKGLKDFRVELNTPEKFEEVAPTWLTLALNTGGLPPVFNANNPSEVTTQKECPRIDVRRLGTVQKNKFSAEAAQLGLMMSIQQAMTHQRESSWGYRSNSKTKEDLVKENLDVAKGWISKGASWKTLYDGVESGETRLYRQWGALISVDEGLRAAWHNEWSSVLQREELSHKVQPKVKRASTQEQFGFAL